MGSLPRWQHAVLGNISVATNTNLGTPRPYSVFLLPVTEDYEHRLPAAENADLSTWASLAKAAPQRRTLRCHNQAPHTSLSPRLSVSCQRAPC